jgi:hypothetical protein
VAATPRQSLALRVVLLVVAALILLLLTLVLAVSLVDWNRARPWVNEKVSTASGRHFAIQEIWMRTGSGRSLIPDGAIGCLGCSCRLSSWNLAIYRRLGASAHWIPKAHAAAPQLARHARGRLWRQSRKAPRPGLGRHSWQGGQGQR